jgi:hypothetical protein
MTYNLRYNLLSLRGSSTSASIAVVIAIESSISGVLKCSYPRICLAPLVAQACPPPLAVLRVAGKLTSEMPCAVAVRALSPNVGVVLLPLRLCPVVHTCNTIFGLCAISSTQFLVVDIDVNTVVIKFFTIVMIV